MKKATKKIVQGLATLVGTIIGAGIFGVPYVMSKAGVVVGLVYFIALTIIMILLHLYFGEIVLAIKERHRFPGFAYELLGQWGKHTAAVLGIFGGWISITAYIILGGMFLSLLLDRWVNIGPLGWSLVFAASAAFAVVGGLRWITRTEVLMTTALLIVILTIIIAGLPQVALAHLVRFDVKEVVLPYGVILFSLSGLAVIPELEDVLGNGQRKLLRRVIVLGILAAAILTAFFGAIVAGISGPNTSSDAISGLQPFWGAWIITIGALFGFLAVATSCYVFLMNQAETFVYDYRMSWWTSRILALGVPLIFFILGARNFIGLIGLAGGFTGGLTGVLIVFMYLRVLEKKKIPRLRWVVPIGVAAVFFVGAAVELWVSSHQFFK
ncbi:MAG: aromatic amino acid transport family protein [bacterium]|nr:aromatic amino acid transport family protein [bacterium]